jgi:hypothetical protein
VATSHAEEILSLVETEGRRLAAVGSAEADVRRAPGTWSRKEVLGHLVDSALNNHQRFVRAALAESLDFPGYAQDEWVRCQDYASVAWPALVELWTGINRHLAHVVRRIPEMKLAVPCRIGGGAAMSLEALVVDYLRHLRHHLAQI